MRAGGRAPVLLAADRQLGPVVACLLWQGKGDSSVKVFQVTGEAPFVTEYALLAQPPPLLSLLGLSFSWRNPPLCCRCWPLFSFSWGSPSLCCRC